jgi:hypothetical protein
MKNLKFVLIVLLIVTQYACKQKVIVKDSDVTIHVDLDAAEDAVSYKDIFSKIEIIPLETNDESVCGGGVTYLRVTKDGSYSIFPFRSESIVMFDKTGAFIKHVNKKGPGPGEYSGISDFNFNRFTGNLEILSPMGHVYIYDSTGVNHIETIKTGEVAHEFANLTDDIYVFYSHFRVNNKIFFFSKKQGKTVGETFPLPDFVHKKTMFHHTYPPFYVYRDSLCFYDAANGNIYTIDPETMTLKPRYQWDMGKYTFDISLINDNESKDKISYLDFYNNDNRYAYCFIFNVENDKYVITTFRFRQKFMTVIYNKNTKKHLLFTEFIEGVKFMPHFVTDEYAYIIADIATLPMEVNNKLLDEENQRKLERIQPDDNSVIVRYKFK